MRSFLFLLAVLLYQAGAYGQKREFDVLDNPVDNLNPEASPVAANDSINNSGTEPIRINTGDVSDTTPNEAELLLQEALEREENQATPGDSAANQSSVVSDNDVLQENSETSLTPIQVDAGQDDEQESAGVIANDSRENSDVEEVGETLSESEIETGSQTDSANIGSNSPEPESTGAIVDGKPTLDLILEVALPEKAATDDSRTADAQTEDDGSTSDKLLRAGLKRVLWLQKTGAHTLAERVLREDRPALDDFDGWSQWERRLWKNYQQRKLWQDLADRIRSLPAEIPDSFRMEAGSIRVDALMRLGNIAEARSDLRKLLSLGQDNPQLVTTWRRLIMRAYLWEKNLEDTNTSMVRFQQQYFPDDNEWNILRARVMLQTGEYDTAISQLASVTNEASRLLRLIGRLEQGSLTPNEVIDQATNLNTNRLSKSLQRDRWALIARAAGRSGVLAERVSALEQALALGEDTRGIDLIPVTRAELIQSYDDLAQQTGNNAHLLMGDIEGWLDYADTLTGDAEVGARAIFVFIGRRVALPVLAGSAFTRYAKSLRNEQLKPLIYALIGPDKPLGGFDLLSGEIGFALSEEALEEGNVKLAAELSSVISEPPDNTSYFHWRLRQSRMNIYAGNYEEGAVILEELLDALQSLAPEELDAVLQLVFDLQSVGRHVLAIPLLEKVLATSQGGQLREVLFWLAESLEATAVHERAALLYLRSASLVQNGQDMWGQSARYRAANALQDAGHTEDARAIYKQLLRVTRDPQRRDQLNRRIQKLWLIESQQATSDS